MRLEWTDRFACDLTDDQRRLCQWVADQARAGATRIYYEDAQVDLDIPSPADLTDILAGVRERLDDIHTMVQWPVVHTSTPYFDIHHDADHIWDSYCHAEGHTCPQESEDLLLCAAGRD